VDARSLAGSRGVAHYTAGLLAALADAYPQDEWLLFAGGRAPLPHPPGTQLRRHALPGRALHGSAALCGRPRLDRLCGGDVDVVLVPAPAPLALTPAVPRVVVFHDLSFAERPHDFTAYERLWHRLARPARLARDATRVIVDATPTREALRARYGVDSVVIAPGVTPPAPGAPPPGLPDRYLLFVGAFEPRKAPGLLLRARPAGVPVVFVGEGRLSPPPGEGVIVLGPQPRPQLEALYAGAIALVMPSHLEGFGLPPLEAALCGTPSVVSDLPVFAETLGDGALRFPAGDEEALAHALRRICEDAALRETLVAAAHAERFTWERAAREVHAVLEDACSR
jgi:glycosyltransferase involved in cell wall biosynthesis